MEITFAVWELHINGHPVPAPTVVDNENILSARKIDCRCNALIALQIRRRIGRAPCEVLARNVKIPKQHDRNDLRLRRYSDRADAVVSSTYDAGDMRAV